MKDESYFKSIKLEIIIDENHQDILNDYIRKFNNIYRYSYNRYVDNPNITLKEITDLNNNLNNTINESHILRCAFIKAKMKYKQTKAIKDIEINDIKNEIKKCKNKHEKFKLEKKLEKTINKKFSIKFGGKSLMKRRYKDLITNNDYKLSKLSKIYIQGEERKMGNRHFKLDIDNDLIIFKLNKDIHIPIKLKVSGKNYRKELKKLQEINNIKQGEKGKTFSVYLDMNTISICFEPFKKEFNNIKLERYMSIDFNPNNIGVIIKDVSTDKLLLKEHIKFNIDDNNKLFYESIEINKRLVKIAQHYQVKYLFLEDLNMVSKNHGKGKSLNKQLNSWNRNDIMNNLKRRMFEIGIKNKDIHCAFTSTIGNLQYEFTDPINAALEIGRRGHLLEQYYKEETGESGYYPNVVVTNRWKKELQPFLDENLENGDTWKKIHYYLKNSKRTYRVSLKDVKYSFNVFRHKCVEIISFN